jgi:phosphatidate cytidylyltransferase
MLKTRLWMGSLLVLLAVLILFEGRFASPWFPFLFLTTLLALLFGTRELLLLMPTEMRPDSRLTLGGIALLCTVNWWQPIRDLLQLPIAKFDVWHASGLAYVLLVVLAFLIEMRRFQGPNQIVPRLGLTALSWFYLGILPSFLLQLRWLPLTPEQQTMALALTIFVPKGNDIGAYFTGKFLTGRILGRTLFTPLLSPKKTWQGFVGGMLASVGVAVGFNAIVPVVPFGTAGLIGFGLTVGLAGVLGDLGESLVKRDGSTKDASKSIPGFGGILDVIDSLLFAAPVAYLWFVIA